MNYSTWIIGLSVINTITVFSGLPTGGKRLVIVITTLALLFIGFILRAVEKKKKDRMEYQKEVLKKTLDTNIDQVAEELAQNIHQRIEQEIDEITHHEPENRSY